jgi:outer membrane lipoprotein SlyB
MRAYAVLAVVSTAFLSSCAAPGGRVYSRWDARTPWTVEDGTIVEVNSAVIDGRNSAIGTFGGGYIGNSVGRAVGAGTGATIAGAVGAVAGAIAGSQVERAATSKKGWEILVKMDDRKDTLAIVQPADEEEFAPGEKVRVYSRRDGSARVVKL